MLAKNPDMEAPRTAQLSMSTTRIFRLSSFLLGMPFLLATSLSAQLIGSHLTDLGALPGGSGTAPLDIDSAGKIVGSSITGTAVTRAILYYRGIMTDLGTLPGGSGSQACGLNQSGQVVGWSNTTGPSGIHAFLLSGGTMTDLGALPGGSTSTAMGINTRGTITGYASVASGGGIDHAVLFTSPIQDLGTLTGGTYSQAFRINDAGTVVGFSTTSGASNPHAFVYSAGAMTDLGTLGGTSSKAYDLNGQGQIVGESAIVGGASHAFLHSGGMMTDLGTLGGTESRANGINSQGVIVGTSDLAGNTTTHAFVFWKGHMYDLNVIMAGSLSTGSQPGFTSLRFATRINVDWLVTGGGDYFDGTTHSTRAFSLRLGPTPVLTPGGGAPSYWFMAVLALLGAGRFFRVRPKRV